MIGKTLGHYQISNQLGKGGMGEVISRQVGFLFCLRDATGAHGFLNQTLSPRRI